MNYLHQFVFGIYPYIATAVFVLGSLIRFDREQYTWKSDSSQMLHQGNLRIGNILFHIGMIGLFFGHGFGLLTPLWVWDAVGISHSTKQMIAMVSGGFLGSCILIGLLILMVRRFTNDRLLRVTTFGDKVLLFWILITVSLGLSTIAVSAHHTDGEMMILLVNWAQHIVTFRGDAASYIMEAPLLFKVHLFMGMSLFLIFPFTRLVHIWSGFRAITYLGRAYQLVRTR